MASFCKLFYFLFTVLFLILGGSSTLENVLVLSMILQMKLLLPYLFASSQKVLTGVWK